MDAGQHRLHPEGSIPPVETEYESSASRHRPISPATACSARDIYTQTPWETGWEKFTDPKVHRSTKRVSKRGELIQGFLDGGVIFKETVQAGDLKKMEDFLMDGSGENEFSAVLFG